MKRQVVVVGLGRFGYYLAEALFSMGHEVLGLDVLEKKVQSIASHITHAVQADATNEDVLKDLGVSNFDVGIIAIGTAIQNSVLSTILLKRLGVEYVIARAENELHGTILEKIGADKVVYLEREVGLKISHGLNLPDILDYMPVSPGYGVSRLAGAPHFTDRTLAEAGFGPNAKWGVAVLLIKRGKEVILTPSADERLLSGDDLVVAGADDKLEGLLNEARKNHSPHDGKSLAQGG